ncbi:MULTISPECIES: flagellin [unclassified Campylobacter]|uniref:flagellin N-terminal helical domain-containing protein n=1 Tax=unclassified Campylobacter TaxID=2593542 RepID=UPI003D331E99
MRITNQLQYAQTMRNYQQGMANVNKYNLQISSGTKIQNSYESAAIYNDGMRLDYEITTLEQIKEATSKSQNFSKNSDKQMLEFSKQLDNFKTKLIRAASDVHSVTSLEALANDLQGIKNHLMNIANSSVNGQFLFSGSAVDTKPISADGTYNGNAESMKTVGGSGIEIPYNINGFDIFQGRDNDYNKILTTNVLLTDKTSPDIDGEKKYITEESKLRNLIGLNYAKDSIASANNDGLKNYKGSIEHDFDFLDSTKVKFPDTFFYMQGVKPDGTSFTSKFNMTHDASIRSVLDKIGIEFGNTDKSKVVDVSLNNSGQIEIKDLTKGSQVLNFHLVAATEQADNKEGLAALSAPGHTSAASVTTLADLETAAKAGKIYITDFTKNNYKDSGDETVNSFDFDKVKLERKDNKLTANITQLNRTTGEYATDATRLSEVANTKQLYTGSEDKYNIDGQVIGLEVKSRAGTKYQIEVKLGTKDPSSPVSFSIKGTDINGNAIFGGATRNLAVYHAEPNGIQKEQRTQTDDFTYRQLMDIIGMAATDSIPTLLYAESPSITETQRKANYDAYMSAIEQSRGMAEVNLNQKGQIVLTDKQNAVTKIEVAMYNANESGKFYGDSTGQTAATKQGEGSVFNFMQNNALTIDEPGIDLFKDLDQMIQAVKKGNLRADADSNNPRNTGIQGAIKRLDHIMDHVSKESVKIGSYTNLLTSTNERSSIMSVNIASVKSDIIDTDVGRAYLNLTQKIMSYQAMLQATSKINQLSLLNYM